MAKLEVEKLLKYPRIVFSMDPFLAGKKKGMVQYQYKLMISTTFPIDGEDVTFYHEATEKDKERFPKAYKAFLKHQKEAVKEMRRRFKYDKITLA